MFIETIKKEFTSFFIAVSKVNEKVYYILFSLYVSLYLILKTAWTPKTRNIEGAIRYSILSLVMWGAALYLFYSIASWKNLWKNTILLILTGAVILVATFFFSRNMSNNSYGVVMDLFFCLMACGKNYKKILRCILGVTSFFLVFAGVGLPLGITYDAIKPENVIPGHSLGIEYPNSWGYLVFLVLMLLWYLYLRHKPLLAFLIFWAVSAFMMFYIYCRTISFFTLAFPVLTVVVDFIERRSDKKLKFESSLLKDDELNGCNSESEISETIDDVKESFGNKENKKSVIKNIITWIVVAIPVISFFFMLITSMNYEWVHDHFYYTWFHNFAMRFVQGGLYFKTYGFPLVGNPYRSNVHTYVNVNGDFLEVGILDSSFAAYMIMRGLLWIVYTMFWLCLANWKAIKKRDYAIPFLCLIILFFAMLERPGLEAWYNFILLYPLAKVASKPGTVKVPEFYSSANTDQIESDKDDATTESEPSTISDEHVADEEL